MRSVESYTYEAAHYVSTEEAKIHLRVEGDEDDAYIATLVKAAFKVASDYVGYEIRKAKVNYTFLDVDYRSRLRIPSRVISVVHAKYYDENAAEQTLTVADSPNTYSTYGYDLWITETPSSLNKYGDKYKVQVYEGFEPSSSGVTESHTTFPEAIRHAIYLILGNLYDNRQDAVIGTIAEDLKMNSMYLLNPYKIMKFV